MFPRQTNKIFFIKGVTFSDYEVYNKCITQIYSYTCLTSKKKSSVFGGTFLFTEFEKIVIKEKRTIILIALKIRRFHL